MPKLTKTIQEKINIEYDIFNENPELPLFIFLHGFGIVEDRVYNGKKSKIPFSAVVPREFRSKFSYLVPYIDSLEKWDPLKIKALIEYMVEERGFNKNKIIISGYSWGARGAFDISTKYPEMFAAVISLAGVSTPLLGPRLRDTPTLIIHGKDDKVVSCTHSSDIHYHIRGKIDSEELHQLFIMEGFGHDIFATCFADNYIWNWITKILETKNEHSLCIQRESTTQ